MKSIFKTQSPPTKKQWLERFLGSLAVLSIIAAWFIGGSLKNSSHEEYLSRALPAASRFKELGDGIFAGFAGDETNPIGYVMVGNATGYGGPLEMAVAVDLDGNIIGLAFVNNKETPAYLKRVVDNSLLKDLLGKSYSDKFELGVDIDGVTQATYTSAAIVESVRKASREIAVAELDKPVPPEISPAVKFGVPEITLILLFAAGYLGRQKFIKQVKFLRWGTMLVGMIILGFLYNQPLTLSKINTFLLGYFPPLQTNLYWYFLIGGIIFVFSADNRNPYCEWFCPFGAAQECMGAIGGAKVHFTNRQQETISWVQRGIAWFAIVIALLYRNPGITSYEVFGTLFQLNGSAVSFAILGLVLIVSLFVHRFWCRVLCPIRPVEGFIRMARGWIVSLWKTKKTTA